MIYLGTFAKALYPAIRLAYAVLPHWLVEPVARARAASDRHPTWSDALAVTRFIESGELERHLVACDASIGRAEIRSSTR